MEEESNTYGGQRSIVLKQRQSRNDRGIRGVLGSLRRRAVVTGIIVALVWVLFRKVLRRSRKPCVNEVSTKKVDK